MAAPGPETFALGRFVEPALYILVSLSDGPKHGYAMLEDIAQLWQVQLGPGTLYGALQRLERAGLIAALPAQDRRHPYELTALGRQVVQTQLTQIQHASTRGLQRLGAL